MLALYTSTLAIIITCYLCSHENFPFTLLESHRVRVSENRMPGGIFGTREAAHNKKMEEIHNEET